MENGIPLYNEVYMSVFTVFLRDVFQQIFGFCSSINCYVPLSCCQSPSSLDPCGLCALSDDLPIL